MGNKEQSLMAHVESVRQVITQMDEDKTWDSVQAKDLDNRITEFVMNALEDGGTPKRICQQLGLPGTGSKQWKKIQAFIRQGFRADAEAYLYKETIKFYRTIEQAKDVWEDAVVNGTPHITSDKEGNVTVTRVKGATKELGSFLEQYAKAIRHPVALWKEFGAIGEKQSSGGGTTIVVENHVPMPSVKDILAHQEEMRAKLQSIEVKGKKVEKSEA